MLKLHNPTQKKNGCVPMSTVFFLTHNTPILKIYGGKYSCLLVYVPSTVIHLHSQTRFLYVFLISFLQPSSFKNQENQILPNFSWW